MDCLRVAYLTSFVVAAVACVAGLRRISRISDPDTRRGLAGLLGLTGAWAATHVGRLLPLAPDVQAGFYLVGLVVGLATIGAWLYFCSAYTGHSYHRQPVIRQSALAVYLAIVAVKLTNPLHHLYFTTSTATAPFPHAVMQLGTVHWIVTALSYTLSAIGFYLLYEMLSESKLDVSVLGGLVAVTALPVGLYLLSFGDDGLLTLHYEPLGVAVFAVGVLYVVDDDFVAVPPFWRTQVMDAVDEVVVLIDEASTIRDVNRRAIERFPALDGATGEQLSAVVPDLADAVVDHEDILAVDDERRRSRRYYFVNSTPLVSGTVEVGRAIICTDVTRVERQRRELERRNDQFDDLAAAITHELRNTLTVANGYFETVASSQALDDDAAMEAYRRVDEAHARMDRIVTDLWALAKYGQTVERVDDCDLRQAAERAFDGIAPEDLSLTVDGEATIVADRGRLDGLFAKAFEFADLYGADSVAVHAEARRIVITVDGEPLPEESIDRAFEYGDPVPSAETGTLFPTMQTIARAHGWTMELDPAFRAGVRIVVDDVDVDTAGDRTGVDRSAP
ncbi:two-component sensor histidine kinase [Haloplanus natans]|uniref:two-component sensor histidine kinase n=1 Tax=Haloplanus natans TaxID=376171 RepID=UPI00067815E8|nr:two-component sensor histidine kinase [Haloplanus natans]